jgi:hypothetical protein
MTTETTAVGAQTSAADEAAVRATIDDYYLGWYDGDGERMARALHPELAKRGWLRDTTGDAVIDRDTFQTMVEFAAAGQGKQTDPDIRRYDMHIDEIHGDIATARVRGVPYIDYLHLVRTADGWRIMNALWCRP